MNKKYKILITIILLIVSILLLIGFVVWYKSNYIDDKSNYIDDKSNYIGKKNFSFTTSSRFTLRKKFRYIIDHKISILPGLPKIIWILWFQGYVDAPYCVKEVIDSWSNHNPDWQIILLTEKNISDYVNLPIKNNATLQAKSDILRLKLLSTYGGVWADATLLCMKPLATWIYKMVKPVGFWMYHGRDNGKGPCSWFIISSKYSPLIQKWNILCENYWLNREEAHDYFWMDILFENERKDETSEFYKLWKNVPFKNCEDIGSSHFLNGRVSNKLDKEVELNITRKKCPYVIKLDKKLPEFQKELLNGHYAIFISKSRDLIIAHCKEDLNWVLSNNIYDNFNNIYIYSKCDQNIFNSQFVPDNIIVKRLENSGQDAGTHLYHIITKWNSLANFNVFTTGKGLDDNHRKDFNIKNCIGKTFLNNYNQYSNSTINLNFTLNDYTPTYSRNEKTKLPFIRSDFNNIKDFANNILPKIYMKMLENWKGTSIGTSFAVDNMSIYKNPINFYKKIYNLVDIGPNNINVHFLERLWVFIFESTIFRPNLYCFWTGKNKMSEDRENAYNTMFKSDFNVVLITPDNLNNYILDDYPLHPGYKYLSETHKSDYLRCYFLHFYGEGYSDIKITERSWVQAYNTLNADNNLYAVGYPEVEGGSVYKNSPHLENSYKILIGNGGFIFKKQTPLSWEYYNKVTNEMNNIFENLKKYPAKDVRTVYTKEYPYPLVWGVFNEICANIMYKYQKNIAQVLPYDGLGKPYR